MEDKLILQSSHEFGKLIADELNSYRQNFVTRSAKFDGECKQVLSVV